ncbi:MAG: ATP-binding cassette domain-containing protein, partial [Deltaproteobacteria bacterium]
INPVSPYALEGFPSFGLAASRQMLGDEGWQGEDNERQFVSLYLLILERIRDTNGLIMGVVERSLGTEPVVIHRLLDSLQDAGVMKKDDVKTLLENLRLYANYFGLAEPVVRQRLPAILASMALQDRRKDAVRSLSGGLRRRLLVARALVNEPELLLLDEPTVGLDPHARHLLWERLRHLRNTGRTLLLSTHYMDEAEQLCDQLVIMDRGQIIAQGSPQTLIAAHAPGEIIEIFAPVTLHPELLSSIEGARSHESLADCLLVFVQRAEPHMPRLLQHFAAQAQILARRSTLEDVYLKLTGRRLAEQT